MVENIRLISAQVVEEVLKYDELIPVIESALGKFSNRPQSGVIQPLRTCLRIPAVDGFLGVMPAYSESDGVLSTKLLTFFPHNSGGLSTHSALTVLFHCQTGVPTAILDADVITAYRTAAASAVATKHLVSGSPKKLAILGAGVQARSHFYALSHLYNFYEVTIWNHRPEKAKALAAELGNHVTSVDDAEKAVRDADVIVTATNSSTPVLKAAWVKSGAHVNGYHCCRNRRTGPWKSAAKELRNNCLQIVRYCH
ncbi:ketimine reductase mu-crystallin-like isoform X2 [Littorina saxatilis]|uniref:ketimine reductase mu-crystallin-like isoform X2 n=1 Tax=Littorina saxatilis TaxID=31220 RepID=UPI0038B58B9C